MTNGIKKLCTTELSNNAYHAIDALNHSKLKYMQESALACFSKTTEPVKQTKDMVLGSVVHAMLLEPESESELVAVFDQAAMEKKHGSSRTNAYKQAKAKWELENIEKLCVDSDTYEQARCMADAVIGHKSASALLSQEGSLKELSLVNHIEGQPVKARLDALVPDGNAHRIVDIKTTSTTGLPFSLLHCEREIVNRKYHLQMAWYTKVLRLSHPGMANADILPTWIFVEKTAPNDVLVLTMDQAQLDMCIVLVENLFNRWLHCKQTNYWPGVSDEELYVALPDYLFEQG